MHLVTREKKHTHLETQFKFYEYNGPFNFFRSYVLFFDSFPIVFFFFFFANMHWNCREFSCTLLLFWLFNSVCIYCLLFTVSVILCAHFSFFIFSFDIVICRECWLIHVDTKDNRLSDKYATWINLLISLLSFVVSIHLAIAQGVSFWQYAE